MPEEIYYLGNKRVIVDSNGLACYADEEVEMPLSNTECGNYYNNGQCWIAGCQCQRINNRQSCPSYQRRNERSCFNCSQYTYGDNECSNPQHLRNNGNRPFHPCPNSGCDYFTKVENLTTKGYKSQDGFEIVQLHRGFSEIIPLWRILDNLISSTKKDCFICGGYARYCASPKYEVIKASDVDIYSQTKSVYNKLVNKLKKKGLEIKSENTMSITYKHPSSGEFHYMPPINVIKPVKEGKVISQGSKETVLSNFDFTIIRAAIESPSEVMVDKDFIYDETHNILRLKNIHHPLSSLLRCFKYTTKGYWVTPTEATKLYEEWDNIEIGSKSELLDYVKQIRSGETLDEESKTSFYELFRGRRL